MAIEKNFLPHLVKHYGHRRLHVCLIIIGLFLLLISGCLLLLIFANYDNRHWFYLVVGFYSAIILILMLYFYLAVFQPLTKYLRFLKSPSSLQQVEIHQGEKLLKSTTLFEMPFITVQTEDNQIKTNYYLDFLLEEAISISPTMVVMVKNQHIVAVIEDVRSSDA